MEEPLIDGLGEGHRSGSVRCGIALGAPSRCRADRSGRPCNIWFRNHCRSSSEKKILDEGAPFLGICVGMQLLADIGFEGETTPGFGWISGVVDKIPTTAGLKIPHMGWNTIKFNRAHSIFNGFENKEETIVYFVHSYYFQVKKMEDLLGICDYGSEITAVIGKDNIIGCQFHPEKSQKIGLKFIENFINWSP